ncbi:tRNA (adenosine(37)-N6)-threonylcarbamoyltransferase complex transferase subunit TsaD [Candidatus Saccharibacteria bacterium]|nr:tRNA (adenosine(37)-N6)-threonylcarbamoyltransferase complex transferase subunit TsaD [Candidatus Saccharibacteria bacterium]
MNILAIESSCDETAAAILSGDPKNPKAVPELLSNVVVSQIDIFKAYGGVIPEIAARNHLDAILPVIKKAFKDANFLTADKTENWDKIDAIAVTHTPGLLGSLLVGTLTARTLAILHDKPLYAVHHLKSHIYANWLENNNPPEFPLLALVISGGHTQIIYMKEHNHFEIIGTTRDDAVGECFDKVAKILGLPYPGGPAITKAADGKIENADGTNFVKVRPGDPEKYKFPHPKLTSAPRNPSPASASHDPKMPNNPSYDFSFSGLKTAVLRTAQEIAGVPISTPSYELKNLLTPEQKADFAASFEKTAVDILLEKLNLARENYPDVKSIVIAGGVSANTRLREKTGQLFSRVYLPSNSATYIPDGAEKAARRADFPGRPAYDVPEFDGTLENSCPAFFPEPRFSGDNAAMVGAAAFYEIMSGVKPTDPYSLDIMPRSEIY